MQNNIVEKFISYLKDTKNFSPHTIRAYKADLKLLKCYLKDNNIEEAVLKYLTSIQNKKIRTYARKISTIRSFLKYLDEHQNIEFRKMIFEYLKYPRKENTLPEFLSYDEVLKIINSIDTKNFSGIRDRVLFEFIFNSGIRVSEATNLKLSQISIGKRYFYVIGKGSQQRYCFFSKESQARLEEYYFQRERFLNSKGIKSEYLFVNKYGKKISERSVHRRLVYWARQSGITKNVHPHMLRHSFATYMLSKGMDIMFLKELLGHKNIDTTQIYTHININQLRGHIEEITKEL